ncbi:hypothetical protein L0156_03205 [bacterium]|nr:hypothetical protein [bacterium]
MIRKFCLTLIVACCSLSVFAAEITQKVDRILTRANIHESLVTVKALTKLGKPAVPYLIERLDTYGHPSIIAEALGKIGDENAALALVVFLKKHNLTEKKDILVIKTIFRALANLKDPRTEAAIHEILMNEKNLTEVRLYAATTLVKIGSEPARGEASEFIMRSPLLTSGRISPIDMDIAYFELGTKEAMDRLFQAFQGGLGYEQLFIVDLLAERTTQEVNEMLLRVAEDKEHFPEVRLRAVETLATRKDVSKERLLNVLYSLQDDVPVQHLIKKVSRGSKK